MRRVGQSFHMAADRRAPSWRADDRAGHGPERSMPNVITTFRAFSVTPSPHDLVDRAIAAYRRFGAMSGQFDAYATEIEGKLFVVVHQGGAAQACYAVRGENRLRRIWQWPDVIW